MHLDRRLSFIGHIQKAVNRAQLTLRLIYHQMNQISTLSQFNKKMYTAMSVLWSILMHGVPVWVHLSPISKISLQRLQNKCLRLILSANRYIPVWALDKRGGCHIPHIRWFSRTFECFTTSVTMNMNDTAPPPHNANTSTHRTTNTYYTLPSHP